MSKFGHRWLIVVAPASGEQLYPLAPRPNMALGWRNVAARRVGGVGFNCPKPNLALRGQFDLPRPDLAELKQPTLTNLRRSAAAADQVAARIYLKN